MELPSLNVSFVQYIKRVSNKRGRKLVRTNRISFYIWIFVEKSINFIDDTNFIGKIIRKDSLWNFTWNIYLMWKLYGKQIDL